MFVELLRSKLAGICELSEAQARLLEAHYELLTRWNQSLNLTSVRTMEEAVERHYCESIFAACHLPDGAISVADIGSGAGFPGIPIAIVRPRSSTVLIESHQRKAVFLREACRSMSNCEIVSKRAEDVTGPYDWLVSRAVKYLYIRDTLRKLGRNMALLTGEVSDVELSGANWQDPLRLPWGERRYLRIGHIPVSRETPVPRETPIPGNNSMLE